MRARVIENKVICGVHYLGFTLETEEQVVFTASQTGRSFRHSDGYALNRELDDLLQKVRKAVGVPSEIPALLSTASQAK